MATAGDFTCADLLEVKARASQAWGDNRNAADLSANVVAAQAVLEQQTVTLPELKDQSKDLSLTVDWVEACDIAVQACDDSCTFTGPEAGATCKTYTLDECEEATFSVTDGKLRKSSLNKEEIVALNMRKAIKVMEENIAAKVVAAVDSFAGVNALTGGIAGLSGSDIPAPLWNGDAFAYFSQVAIMNKFTSPWMLSGSNLYQLNWLARQSSTPDELRKLTTFPQYFDLFNVDGTVGKKTYLIDRGAVALISKVYYGPTPESRVDDLVAYSMPSDRLPGVSFDVYYDKECLGLDDIRHNFKIVARYGIFQNPINECNPDNTGVLAFECVNP